MEISNLEKQKEYRLIHSYGKPAQKVKVLSIDDVEKRATVKHTSKDCTNGLVTEMNEIECQRYLREI